MDLISEMIIAGIVYTLSAVFTIVALVRLKEPNETWENLTFSRCLLFIMLIAMTVLFTIFESLWLCKVLGVVV